MEELNLAEENTNKLGSKCNRDSFAACNEKCRMELEPFRPLELQENMLFETIYTLSDKRKVTKGFFNCRKVYIFNGRKRIISTYCDLNGLQFDENAPQKFLGTVSIAFDLVDHEIDLRVLHTADYNPTIPGFFILDFVKLAANVWSRGEEKWIATLFDASNVT